MLQTLEYAEEESLDDYGENIPSTGLTWPGANADQLAFKRAVYDRQVARASARRSFVGDVPAAELGPIEEGHRMRTAAALSCVNLLTAARSELASQRAAGNAAAGRVEWIKIASAYRSSARQFAGWNTAFSKYYARTAEKRRTLAGGEHGPAAVEHTARYVGARMGAPGYSNHNNGLAIDFRTRDSGRNLGPDTSAPSIRNWRASWYFAWLTANAGRFNFHENTAIDEPWHWEYRGSTGTAGVAGATASALAGAAASAVGAAAAGLAGAVGAVAGSLAGAAGITEDVPAGRQETARVNAFRGHRGSPPDLILRWNSLPDNPQVVDVVVHLHGYSGAKQNMSLARDKERISGLDYNDPDNAATAGRTRPTLGILPRGHYFGGRSGAGYSFPALVTPTGLQDLVTMSLAQLGSAVNSPNLRMGRLIITAHSGGGAPLMTILGHLNPHEVHVFDGTYGDAAALSRWARRRIRADAAALAGRTGDDARSYMQQEGGALRVFYRPGTPTQAQAVAVNRAVQAALRATGSRATLADWYRVEQTTVGHNAIPRQFGWRMLTDASAPIPEARPAREDVEEEPFQDDSFEAAARTGTVMTVTITGQQQGAFKNEIAGPPPGRTGSEVLGFEYSVTSPRDAASGMATGRRRHGAVSFAKEWGPATPQLFQALVSNETLTQVVFEVRQQDARSGREEVAQVYKLLNARISEIKHAMETRSTAALTPTIERISLVFESIQIENKAGQTTASDHSSSV